MSEIIQKWLSSRIGVILDLNLLSFGDIAKDGYLLAQILHSYGILNDDDLNRIIRADYYGYAVQNLHFLNTFFKALGIDYSTNKLEAIAHGDGMMALRLFYQLYLILNNTDKLYFITNKITSDRKEENIVPITKEPQTPETEKTKSKTTDLDSTAAVYKWHKNKYIEQYFKCKEIRIKYLEQFENTIKSKHVRIEENKKSYDELKTDPKLNSIFNSSDSDVILTLESHLQEYLPPEFRCNVNVTQAKEFVSKLKKKSRKFIEEKKLQKFMHKIFLQNLLETLLEKQRQEYVNSVTKKVLKQSYYEKQMETKLLEIRKQKDTMIYNRKLENEYLLKKKDEKFIAELYQQKHNVALVNLKNDNERKRILELHKRLYKEKCERKYQKHLKIAQGIVDDLITITMKSLKYKDDFEADVPSCLWKNWITLFCAEQEITDPIDNAEELLKGEDKDDVLTAEIYRQNRLDQKDMSDYISSEFPWNIEEMCDVYNDSYNSIKLGENVLGYTVHRVLKVKYPFPPPINTPVLPKVKYAASVIGCTDETLTGILVNILKKKQIRVVNIQSAINYCLNAFLKEDPKEPDVQHEKDFKEEVQKEISGKKGEKGAAKTKEETVKTGMEMKETQTPKRFPDEEIPLSPQAVLGEYAHKTMKLGLPLNDRLIASMFVEYLKSLTQLKGWVLMNYPEDMSSAITLESALSGHPMVFEDDDTESLDEEYTTMDCLRDELFVEQYDEFEQTRISKLIPNIKLSKEPEKRRSYLNSFIYLMHDPEATDSEVENFMHRFAKLKNFYDKLGCNNSMYYSSLDPDTIKDIILGITRDDIFASDMYDEIVQTVIQTLEARKRDEEEALIMAELEKTSEKNKGKPKTFAQEIIEVKEVPKPRPRSEPEIIVPPPKPGEEKWPYVDLPQPPEIQTNLASFWEEIEEIYLNDFKQLFFLKRLCQNAIIPYVHKNFKHMMHFIDRPDNKQEYLYKFQIIYNELENDLREDDEFKIEMHCRISEFKSKLWDICITKMRETEAERIRIINESWFYDQTAMYLTIYNSALQLELDRCSHTYYFLQDYYYAMTPIGLIESKYIKFFVKKYDTNDKHAQYLNNIYSDINSNIEHNPYVSILNVALEDSLKAASLWYTQALTNWKKIETAAAADKAKRGKQKLPGNDPPLTDFEKKMDDLINEWQCAIEGENLRIKYRLKLLNVKAKQDLYELLYYGENMFHEIYAKLDKRYNDELESVNKVCEVLSKAVEACESIQPRLILDGSKFYIESKELLYDDPLEIPPLFKEEVAVKRVYTHFTIDQLSKLADVFSDLAPRDSIPTKSFVYIIQDIVAHIPENTEESLVPHYWQLLSPEKIQEIIISMFGKVEYLSWKDFIIYNMELPFPTEMEIQTTRHQFRELDPDKLEFVNVVQFHMIEFWFENDFIRPNNKVLIKNLLAKLFKITDDRIHYSALLLSFCKDKDPILGVAKAFGLSMGKLMCWDEEIGKNYVEILAYQNYLKEQARLEAQQTAENIFADIVTSVVLTSTVASDNTLSQANENSPRSMGEESINGEIGSYILEEAMPEEVDLQFMPELCYTLPFNIILVILTAAMPWHYRVKCIEDNSLKEILEIMYEGLRNEEHNCVFVHEFLNSTAFKNYFSQNMKFVALSPAEIIETELEVCTCTKDENSVSIIDN